VNQFRAWSACALLGALTLAACGSDDSGTTQDTTPATPTINVIAGSGTVEQVVAEIYAQALEDAGFRVGRKDPVADVDAAYDAVVGGRAQLTVVHSGQLLARLDPDGTATEEAAASTTTSTSTTTTTTEPTDDTATDDTATDDTATDDTATDDTATDETATDDTAESTTTAETTTTTTIEQRYPIQVETAALDAVLPDAVVTGGPAFADDRAVIACTAAVIGDGEVTTISDLADVDGGIRLVGPASFESGDTFFGLDELDSVYGITPASFEAVTAADAATAIEDGEADCLVATQTSPIVLQQNLVILVDDQGAIPADFLLPVFTTGAGTVDVLTTIDGVNAQLSTDILRALIVKVDVDGASPDEAAAAFFTATAPAS